MAMLVTVRSTARAFTRAAPVKARAMIAMRVALARGVGCSHDARDEQRRGE